MTYLDTELFEFVKGLTIVTYGTNFLITYNSKFTYTPSLHANILVYRPTVMYKPSLRQVFHNHPILERGFFKTLRGAGLFLPESPESFYQIEIKKCV